MDTVLGENREVQVAGLVAMYLAFKLLRANTWEEFIANAFIYGKVATVLLFLMSDLNCAIGFAVLCALQMLFLK